MLLEVKQAVQHVVRKLLGKSAPAVEEVPLQEKGVPAEMRNGTRNMT